MENYSYEKIINLINDKDVDNKEKIVENYIIKEKKLLKDLRIINISLLSIFTIIPLIISIILKNLNYIDISDFLISNILMPYTLIINIPTVILNFFTRKQINKELNNINNLLLSNKNNIKKGLKEKKDINKNYIGKELNAKTKDKVKKRVRKK